MTTQEGKPKKRGRKRMFETPEAMWEKASAYLNSTDRPTISGLALDIGFCDRFSLYHYEYDYPEFKSTIARIRASLTAAYEQQAIYGDKQTGAIFMLKNLGYSDRVDILANSKVEIDEHKTIELKAPEQVMGVLQGLADLRQKEELRVIEYDGDEDEDDKT